MTVRMAAQVFRALAAIVGAFQVALVLGAPWGRLTWGGRYDGALPGSMRGVAAFSLLLMVVFAWVISMRAGNHGPRPQRRARWFAWIVVGYCGLGVIANAITPSPWERVLWLPIVASMLVTSVIVARAPLSLPRGDSASVTLVAMLVAMLVATLSACAAPSEMPQLAGTYVLSFGIDTLRLDSAGTYRRSFGWADALRIDQGRWGLGSAGRVVVLHDFPRRWPEHGNHDPKKGWHVPDTTQRHLLGLTIERSWSGGVRLGVMPEIGWRYVKLDLP